MSHQEEAKKPEEFREFLLRGLGYNPSLDVREGGDHLQETFYCFQFLHQVLSHILLED